MTRERILVVDDEADIRDVLRLTLESEGYKVYEAANGEEAIDRAQKLNPNLILLDFKMPRLDGKQVCLRLKKDTLLQHLPIIMLTSLSDVADKVEGMEAGADDYIVKPFEPTELVARVRMILRRTARALDANPLTKLPGNASILEELQERIRHAGPYAVCYLDLDNFKAFNDTYGFERGDQAIKKISKIILMAMRDCGTPDDFLGHIGGDDFVLITSPNNADKLCQRIVSDVFRTTPALYDENHRKAGFIEGHDREGTLRRFPLLTISAAVVTNLNRTLTHVAEIAQIGAEMKEWLKKQGGNRWIKDRRADS